ncbi:MAG: hypothetical protein E6Q40_11690 [Cupriavidus sp.]|nr:MAG: hypothetical protein E6Q40_11690 [Cupriavidus sp.]
MSILRFPERGPWGASSWRGNCSGYIYQDLFKRLKPQVFVDPMVGSGTSVEVAKEMGIEAYGLDLHSGFNILRMSIASAVGKEADLCISHPPYGGMVLYSGEQWGDPHPDDLSRCVDDEDFHQKMQVALLNQREATRAGGYYGTIIGDWRRQGRYTSYQAECISRMPADELAAVIIKEQFNTTSGRTNYTGKLALPMILHEYILLWRKPRQVMAFLDTLKVLAQEQQARLSGTWKSIVRLALLELGGDAPLDRLYEHVAKGAPDRLAANPHWQAKVRQTLNSNLNDFQSVERGHWRLAA